MKAFLEEYGLIIVVSIVVLMLVGASTGIGESIVDAIEMIIDNFTNQIGQVAP